MAGLRDGEAEVFVEQKLGDGCGGSNLNALHRRSKSASEKSDEFSRPGASSLSKYVVPHGSPTSTRTYGTQTPSRGMSVSSTTSSSSNNHRASLEKDGTEESSMILDMISKIQQLQLRLQQEKAMRDTLEKAMGRTSSTLSPGHRHFACQSQTKDLISEIELLEEEVTNREQRVLALYRSIFEECVSRAPSEQSSGMSSPAHAKIKTKKHPRIISSAFCSSKKFPLQPFQALSSKNIPGKRELKGRQSSYSAGKSDVRLEKIYSNSVKGRSSSIGKAVMVKTLKDHLNPCPSKLSEEMIRCMAALYCWLLNPTSVKSESDQLTSPHNSQEEHARKSLIEISSIPADRNHFSRASYAISNYRVLVEQLEKVNLHQMDSKHQLAFWINIYNALIMHAYLAYGIPKSSLRRLALFHKAAYNIGGHVISANTIEHAIFRFRMTRAGGWIEMILSTALRKKSTEEKEVISSKFSLPNLEPLVCFTLCTGAHSDPALRVYTPSGIMDQLEAAKREFLQANIVVKKSRKVFLPKLLERYAREASIGSEDLLKWICDNVDQKLRDSIQKCSGGSSRTTAKKANQIIDWLPYSSKFRYLLTRELASKPWWL